MIKKLTLKNIQSHANTVINFDKGINAIIGSSNNGKSAILRGLNWCRYNRPLGIDNIVSHWNIDEKGNLKDESFVSIENEDHVVIRRRTKNDNQYIVDNIEQNVVKSDIPSNVTQALRLTDTNIQNQQDSPFLLSQTSGEVAKYFNKIVNLDVIDRILTNAESSRRRLKSDIENYSNDVNNFEKELEKFNNLDLLESKINECKQIENEKNQVENNVNKYQAEINEYLTLQDKIYDFSDQNKIINEIEKIDLKSIQKNIYDLEKDIDLYAGAKIYDFSDQKRIISKIEEIGNKKNKIMNDVMELKNNIDEYNQKKNEIKNSQEYIADLKSKLPEICPYCGKRL